MDVYLFFADIDKLIETYVYIYIHMYIVYSETPVIRTLSLE